MRQTLAIITARGDLYEVGMGAWHVPSTEKTITDIELARDLVNGRLKAYLFLENGWRVTVFDVAEVVKGAEA